MAEKKQKKRVERDETFEREGELTQEELEKVAGGFSEAQAKLGRAEEQQKAGYAEQRDKA